MKTIYTYIMTSLILLGAASVNAQLDFRGYLTAGAGGGTNIFFGDLKQKDFFPVSENNNEWRFGGSAYLQYHVSPVFSIRGQGLYGEISGTKRDLNRYFDATVLEGNFNAVVNFSNWFGQYNPDRFLSVYGFVGIGMTNYTTDLKYLSNDQPISEDKDNDGIIGPHYVGTVPGGLGLMFRLAHGLHLDLEFSLRALDTDLLDKTKGDFEYDMYSYNSLSLGIDIGKPGKAKSAPRAEPDFAQQAESPDDAEADQETDEGMPDEAAHDDEETTETKQPEPENIVVEEVVEPVLVEQPAAEIVYKVQVCAMKKRELNMPAFRKQFNFERPIQQNYQDGYYLYSTGSFSTYAEAKKLRDEIRKENKLPGAFVVAYRNGKRLSKFPE